MISAIPQQLNSIADAQGLLARAWPAIVTECRYCLGGELHYQAMVYHGLRVAGGPARQIGMNVKQYIERPVSPLFQTLDLRKHQDFRGGFEPIPDVVLFTEAIAGDWRRRQREMTLRQMLMAIEVKASERANARLRVSEVIGDIRKLAAHRVEIRHRDSDMYPVMMVIDTAPKVVERMTEKAIVSCKSAASEYGVAWMYVAPNEDEVIFAPVGD